MVFVARISLSYVTLKLGESFDYDTDDDDVIYKQNYTEL